MACGRWATALLLAACTFDSNTQGGSGELGGTETEGTTSGDPSTVTESASTMSGSSSTTSEPTTTTSEPTTTTDPPTTTEPTTTETETGQPGTALLVLSDAFDFGPIDVGTSATHMFTLTNDGDAAATGVTPLAMPEPFAIESTDCGASLEPAAMCTITIAFAPEQLGPFSGTLDVAYDDGQAAQGIDAGLDGGGAGQTSNLIENADAESCAGNAPTDWMEIEGTNWACVPDFFGLPPHGGDSLFIPGQASMDSFPDLRQIVNLPDDLVTLIANGDLELRFSGWSMSAAADDDPRRFRLQWIDEGDNELDEWDSGWAANTEWTESTDVRIPDPDTVQIRVHLECDMDMGSYCSGMYDDLDLRLVYPPT